MISDRYRNNGKYYRKLAPIAIKAREELIGKINDGDYTLEKYDCECGCSYDELVLLSEKERYGIHAESRICPACGLVMLNPRLTQDSYNDFYDTLYNPLFRETDELSWEVHNDNNNHGREIAEYIEKNYKKMQKDKILEIGTADGAILEGIKQLRPDVRETGIDLGGEYIRSGRERGLNLYQMNSAQLSDSGETFDVIILSHVLEHMLDLESEFGSIRKLLATEGVLYIEVPGIKDIPNMQNDFLEYLTIPHVRYFTLGTLENVMNKYGFEIISGDEYIRSLWKYTGNMDRIAGNYYDDIMGFINGLERANRLEYRRKELRRRYKTITDAIREYL